MTTDTRTRALPVLIECRRQLSLRGVTVPVVIASLSPILLAALLGSSNSELPALGVHDVDALNAPTFVAASLGFAGRVVFPFMIAIVCGTSVSGDSARGCLPALLMLPLSRSRLLTVKTVASLSIVAATVVLHSLVAYLVGLLAFGSGPLIPLVGAPIAEPAALWRLSGAVAYIVVYSTWICALALMFSVLSGRNPAIAVGGTLVSVSMFAVIGGVSQRSGITGYLPTRNYEAWLDLTTQHIYVVSMLWGIFLSLLYGLVLIVFAGCALSRKDIQL